jgi:hypothetical protein
MQVCTISTNTTPVNVTSITDPNGVTYTKLTERSFVTVADGRLTVALGCKNEIWIGRGSLGSTTGTVTVNLDATAGQLGVAGVPWTGASTAIIDTGGIETWQNDNPAATVNGVSHTTRTANTAIIWAGFAPSQPSGLGSYQALDVTFGGVTSDADTFNAGASGTSTTGWMWTNLSHKIYSSIQTGLAIAGTNSLFNQIGIVFAITADTPPADPNFTYLNHNGSGDRRGTITVTTNRADLFLNRDTGANAGTSGVLLEMLIDGYPTATVNQNPATPSPTYPFSLAINPSTTAGDWIKFQFDVAEKVQGFFTKGSVDWNGGVGVWQWYGSNDDATYYALGVSFTWENDQNNFPAALNNNYYTYYKLQMVSGTVSGTGYTDAPIQTEFEFQLISVGETPTPGGSYANLFGSDHREPQGVVVTTNESGGNYAGFIGNLVSGSTGGSDTNNAVIFTSGGVTSNGKYIRFDFPRKTIVDEFTLWQSGGFDEGDFNFDASNDGSTWTTLCNFTWDQVQTVVPTGNHTDAFLYYRMIGTNASKHWSVFPWLFEAQFSTQSYSPLEIGDRHSLITVTTTATVNTGTLQNVVNGDESSTDVTWNDSNVTGKDITFDFGATSIVVAGIQLIIANNSSVYGTWQAQTWDGASWNNISGASFTIGGITPVTGGGIPIAAVYTWNNAVAATKFRLLGVSGTMNDGGNAWNEINFIVAAPVDNFMAAVEAPDVFHAVGYPGYPGITGALTTSEAKDIFAGHMLVPAVGFLQSTEAKDVFFAFIRQPLTGHLAATEAPDIFHGTGIGRGEDGVLITTEAKDTMAATGTVPVVAVMHAIEATDRFRALGAGAHRVRRHRHISAT